MRIYALSLALLSGCFQVTHRSGCEVVSVTPVADDEITATGTANELLDRLLFDNTLPATWQDRRETTAEIQVSRGAGEAEWVTQKLVDITHRSLGFGNVTLTIYVECPDHLRVPIDVEVRSADGALAVSIAGSATQHAPSFDDALRVYFDGVYSDATLPSGEQSPADYTDKYSFVNLTYDEVGLLEGSAGWGGERHTEDTNSAIAEYLLDFSVPEEPLVR